MKMLITLVFLLWTTSAFAVDVFVDNNVGCPGSGTSGSPYCSIQNALNNAVAGHVIKIRTGTGVYSGTNEISGKNGTAGNPIIIEPDAGASFVLRNTSTGQWAASLRIKESDHWIVRNLTFDANGVNPSLVAMHVQCETKNCVGWLIQGNTFRNWRGLAAASVAPQALAFQGCATSLGCPANRTITGIIENNLFENIDRQAMGLLKTLDTHVRNNEIRTVRCGRGDDTAANALGMHLTYGNHGVRVYGNNIHDFATQAECPITNGGNMSTAGIWCDVDIGPTDQNSHVFQNTVFNLDNGDSNLAGINGALSHAAQGIFIEAGCAGWRVYNNIVYNIGHTAIRHSYHSLDVSQPENLYYNNTIFNIAMSGFWMWEGRANFKNNIIKNVGTNAINMNNQSLSQLTSDFNLYDDGGTQTKIGAWSGTTLGLPAWRTACGCDANSTTGDPLFVSTAPANFNLTATSPAINTGTNVGFAFNGSNPDRGAFETIGFSTAEVGKIAVNTVAITFTNNRFPPLLPASACTGFTVEENTGGGFVAKTINSCARNTPNQIYIITSTSFSGASTARFSYSPGNVSDSALIGNSLNQRLNGITNQSITNNVAGGPPPVVSRSQAVGRTQASGRTQAGTRTQGVHPGL